MNEEAQTLYQRILAYPLDSAGASFNFSLRLAKENGWAKEYSRRVIGEYKKFVLLAMTAGHVVSPSDQVDQVWHLHLTYTRAYWEDFCKETLGIPLHHEPTRGGHAEKQKFWQLYQQTLASYERLFNEKPPSDIWPTPEQRFGRDVHFVRVNTQQHWRIPKPSFSWPKQAWQPIRVLPLLLLSVVIAGCAAVSPLLIGSMTVTEVFWFDRFMTISAKDFLVFYAVTGCSLLLIASALNDYWSMSLQPSYPAGRVRLSTEQLAYLAGGSDRLIHTALVALIEQGNIKLSEDKQRFELASPGQPKSPVEQAIIDAINNGRNEITDLLAAVKYSTVAIHNSLVAQGLWVGAIHHKTGLLFIPLIVLGLARLSLGMTADRPVGFLIALLIITVLTPLMIGHDKRTSYGDEALKCYQSANESGNMQQSLCYVLAITGLSVLTNTALADIGGALASRRSSNSGNGNGGGGGGGGGCGGDGGGGCGGCGGCGG